MIKRNMITPLAVALGLILLLSLAWLPGDSGVQQQKPEVAVAMHYDADNRRLQTLAEDLSYRMRTHHEYRLTESEILLPSSTERQQVVIYLSEESGLVSIRAEIDEQAVAVNAPSEVALNLPGKLFSLINSQLQEAN
ncbi:hypothetical protein CWE09_13955 [Aliidiomarina minuta]|uniref:Uncharacterized protein n=1 Tax=Aliidiomarina minuta TaxID=880057 RepID=A0A432W1C9_9GAMM|nr:hypothetical protein [Aliidiomarina minuta]RUO23030.1 hypothetical protein CWE09_13955 [Aliidiomarina minuta]